MLRVEPQTPCILGQNASHYTSLFCENEECTCRLPTRRYTKVTHYGNNINDTTVLGQLAKQFNRPKTKQNFFPKLAKLTTASWLKIGQVLLCTHDVNFSCHVRVRFHMLLCWTRCCSNRFLSCANFCILISDHSSR